MSFLDAVTYVLFWPIAIPLKLIQCIVRSNDNSEKINFLLDEKIKEIKSKKKGLNE